MAKNKAIISILKQGLNQVTFQSGYFITPEGRYVVGEMPVFSFDSLGYDGISEDFTIMEKYYDDVNFLMAVLVGPKADSGKYNSYYDYKEYSDWMHQVPRDGQNLFAVGYSPHYIYESSSWETATYEAIIELSCQLDFNLKSAQVQSGGIVNGGTLVEVNVSLQNWRVVARIYDPLYKIHYVLVKMPLN